MARQRLEGLLAVLVAQASADGEVGDASPVVAAADALRRDPPYDDVIVSTHRPGVSLWLKMDLPHRLDRLFGVPVHHVAGTTSEELLTA